jgi:hypothetical protein
LNYCVIDSAEDLEFRRIFFRGTSATMQKSLMQSGSTVVKEEIKKGAEAAKFVSILLTKRQIFKENLKFLISATT